MSHSPSPLSALTQQQSLAVFTREVSVVLSSGAGCGKTHVLTERYLAHLREGAEVAQIVAITFTDRAARQMRGRIRKAVIGHLRDAADDATADTWARHLRALENAPISTIHAFCGNLLRQFAVESGLDPRFAVLEEVLSVNLRSAALGDCLQRLLMMQSPVADDLRELVLLYGWRAVGLTISSLAYAHDHEAWDRWLARPDEEIAADTLAHAHESLLPRHLALSLRTRPAIGRCLDLLRRHPPQPGPMSEPVANILRELPLLPQAADLTGAIKCLTEWAKVGKVGSKAWPDPEVYLAIKEAFEEFRDTLRQLKPERFDAELDDLLPGIVVGKRFVRVAREAVAAYRDSKRQHGVVDFDDLLWAARELLLGHPDVRGRLHDRFRHVLVDELQDTDPVQMDLVEALTGGGLATGKLFAVGDHKQSIYRFRGADVSLFQSLAQRMSHEGRQSLSVNFRSQPAILHFVNALCGKALEDYEPLVAHQPQANPGPCVEFLWSVRPDDASVAEARAIEAETIAGRIAAIIDAERLVVDSDSGVLRPVKAGDVVLLFRAMSNVHLYENALRKAGLHYYLVGGRAFFAQQEIYDLHHLLKALENPFDDLSLAGALRSPFCCVSDEALFALCRHRAGLWAALADEPTQLFLPADQRDRVRRARLHLRDWREVKDRLPIASLIQRICADTGYDAALQMEFLGERKLANLWKLLDLARTFDRSGLFGLAEFVARLGDLIVAQPREEQAATQPENADVVRLMTIHQAKGLEFPVVFLPDVAATGGANSWPNACWDGRFGCVARPPTDEEEPPFPPFAWSVRQASEELEEWAEDLRTLYVACTRPRDYLVLSAALPADYRPSGPWMLTLASTFDLTTGACRAAGQSGETPRVHIGAVAGATPTRTGSVEPPRLTPSFPPEITHRRGNMPVEEAELACRLAGNGLFAEEQDPEVDSTSVLVRRILDRWDFRDREHGRSLLEQMVVPGAWRDRLTRIVDAFADSDLRQRLGKAPRVRRCVDYTWRPDGEEELPAVCGTIDCLFSEEGDAWHLIAWVTEAVSVAGQAELARRRQRSLAPAALSLGRLARSMWIVFVHEGRVVEKPVSRLVRPGVVDDLMQALASVAGDTIYPSRELQGASDRHSFLR